jgi:NAD(P)-dependent dehydrogenase (short-subunit alcohol dehydrogenase family)
MPPQSGILEGKTAVVTGGNRGIGRAIVERFVSEGASVVNGSRADPPEDIPADAAFVRTDVANAGDTERLIDEAVARYGSLDVLVNNAAILDVGAAADTTIESWERVLSVNLRGVFLCSKFAIPHLRRAGGGSIINIASIDGLWAEPQLAAYCASKGGVIALTRSIALDYGNVGIRCNSICPSYVLTDQLEQYFDAQESPAARQQAEDMHPVGRMSSPAEVAGFATWLASDEASFASGQAYVLDGALLAGRST